jgi:hypothetical protein
MALTIRENRMKKLVAVMLVAIFASSVAQACPKGTHLTGGAGKHHKGGICKK